MALFFKLEDLLDISKMGRLLLHSKVNIIIRLWYLRRGNMFGTILYSKLEIFNRYIKKEAIKLVMISTGIVKGFPRNKIFVCLKSQKTLN